MRHPAVLAPPTSPATRPVARGMVWVAWRQHKNLVLIALTLYFVAQATVVVLRSVQARKFVGSGLTDVAPCRDVGMTTGTLNLCERWLAVHTSWEGAASSVASVSAVMGVLFGLGIGSVIVGHECERSMGEFSFTQSVAPTRWAATTLLVIGVPYIGVVALLDLISGSVLAHLEHAEDSAITTSGVSFQASVALIAASMIALGFAASVLGASASGGFWGGLLALMVAGVVAGLVAGVSTTSSTSSSFACNNPDAQVCMRTMDTAFGYQRLTSILDRSPVQGTGALWSMLALVVVSLTFRFLFLRRRFR